MLDGIMLAAIWLTIGIGLAAAAIVRRNRPGLRNRLAVGAGLCLGFALLDGLRAQGLMAADQAQLIFTVLIVAGISLVFWLGSRGEDDPP